MDPVIRSMFSVIANKIISRVSTVMLHDYGCTLKAYRRFIVKELELYGEMHRFIPIYANWLGARIAEIIVDHRPRLHGQSKYNMWRIVKVILDLITIKFMGSFKTKPIYFFGGSGILCFFLSFLCLIYLVYSKFSLGISMIQSPVLLLSAMLVIVGVQLILMGVIAEMLIRTHFEVLKKKTYVIKEKINF